MASRMLCRDCLRVARHQWNGSEINQIRPILPSRTRQGPVRSISTSIPLRSSRSSQTEQPREPEAATSSERRNEQHERSIPVAASESRPNPTTPKTPPTKQSIKYQVATKFASTFDSAKTYINYSTTQEIFNSCSNPGSYTLPPQPSTILPADRGLDVGVGKGFWYEELGLPPTFNTWTHVTYLHMYVVLVRLRCIEDAATVRNVSQLMLDHFSHAAEDRMEELHGIVAKSVRTKYLKDLFVQWRGIMVAYDEGLIKGDAVLAASLWRNLWGGGSNTIGSMGPGELPEAHVGAGEVDWRKVAVVVHWMRRVTSLLADVSGGNVGESVIYGGALAVKDEDWLALKEAKTVMSNGIEEPFQSGEPEAF